MQKLSSIVYIMENKKALQLISKIQENLNTSKKIDFNEIINQLKEIREYSLEEKNPVVTKALRLAYEHLQNNNAFLISIPEDDSFDEENELETTIGSENNLESFAYFLSLIADQSKKNNILDLKAYNQSFLEF
ncbi:hypothetical protein [Flavobacterium sp.]|uniref:hypothetical protein n=1 Tax=Flavobacterium sp. TaxID=239 RepID=UPI003528F86D